MHDEALRYTIFALAFGWTPAEVDDQPVVLIERMATVLDVRSEVARQTRPAGGIGGGKG